MKFNSKKIWANVKEPAIIAAAGAGANIAVDAALQSVEATVLPSLAQSPNRDYYVNGGKLLLGAVLAAATGNKWVQLAGTGLATVGASNLANAALDAIIPDAEEKKGTGGVPFIGGPRRIRMGQPSFRNVRPAVRGTGKIGAVPFQAE